MMKLFKKFKRDIAMIMAIVLVVGLVAVIPARADEGVTIIDTSKMMCIEYAGSGTIAYFIKQVILQGDVDETASPVVNAVVKLNVMEEDGQGGENLVSYEVMRLTTNADYGKIDDMEGCDGAYVASLVPVYTIRDSGDSDYAYPEDYFGAIVNYDNFYQALTYEIIDYFDAWLESYGGWEIGGAMTIDYDKVVQGLLSDEYKGSYSIEYTYEDNNEYAGDNKVKSTVSGVEIKEYTVSDMDTYDYGKKVEYNRLEDLSSYREDDEFDYIKMYKGSIYVDVDKLPTQSDRLLLPNLNRTQLLALNSMYVNEQVLYNDGMTANDIDVGYNLYNTCIPNSVESVDEAIAAWFDMLNSDYGVDMPDYNSDEMESARYKLYQTGMLDMGDVHIRMNMGYYEGEDAYLIYVYEDKTIEDEAASLIAGEDKEIVLKGMELPEIDITQEFNSGQEFRDYVEACRDYLYFVKYCYNSYEGDDSGIIYEPAYAIVMTDGHRIELSLYQLIDVINELTYAIIVEPEEGEELGEDEQPTTSIRDIENEIRIIYDYTGYKYNMIDKIVLTENVFDNAERTIYWENVEDNYGYLYEGITAYDVLSERFANVGLNFEELEVMVRTEKHGVLLDENAKDEVMQILKETASDQDNENGIYDEFVEYIKEEVVTYGVKVSGVTAGDSSQKKIDIDVTDDVISIPMDMFNYDTLGKKYLINQLWYTGNTRDLYVYKFDDNGETVLYQGKEVKVKWEHIGLSWDNDRTIDTTMGQLVPLPWNEYLWSTLAAEVVFAKIPETIEPQTVTTSNEDSVVITWDAPSDNGAEILGYQIAIVPKGSAAPTDEDYILTGDDAGSYVDLGDDYEIKWTTADNSYEIVWTSTYSRTREAKSVDVYIRAVNALGTSDAQVITVINTNDQIEPPADGDNDPVNPPADGNDDPVNPPADGNDDPVKPPVDGNNDPVNPPADGNNDPVKPPADDSTDDKKEDPKVESAPITGDNKFIIGFVFLAMLSGCVTFYLADKKKEIIR